MRINKAALIYSTQLHCNGAAWNIETNDMLNGLNAAAAAKHLWLWGLKKIDLDETMTS